VSSYLHTSFMSQKENLPWISTFESPFNKVFNLKKKERIGSCLQNMNINSDFMTFLDNSKCPHCVFQSFSSKCKMWHNEHFQSVQLWKSMEIYEYQLLSVHVVHCSSGLNLIFKRVHEEYWFLTKSRAYIHCQTWYAVKKVIFH
jgi:hypothetical protein